MIPVLDLHGKVLVAGGYRGGAAPMSDRASSKRGPLLAKAEAISDTGSTSDQIFKGKNFCDNAVREE